MNSYVLCVRDLNRENHFSSGLDTPRYLAVPPGAEEPLPAHAMPDVNGWMTAVLQDAKSSADPKNGLEVVFFVHGYNTDPVEALKRQRLVENELNTRGFKCLVIGFDWPTGGTAAAYLYDRLQAQQAALILVEGGIIPFAQFQSTDCPIGVHVMAHSMGAFVVREAFRATDKSHKGDVSGDWKVGQMVFFGADVSSSCFDADSPDMQPVFAHCGRLTNYFSGYDEALAVSNVKNMDISSRVGRVGMPTRTPGDAKAVDVDCGPRYQAIPDRKFQVISGMVSHSWYLEDARWYEDLAYTLKGDLDRNLIPTRDKVGENDFVLKVN